MCNRAERGQTDKVLRLFKARPGLRFNEGPMETHPGQPGTVIRIEDGERVLEQMIWGFPVRLKSKKTGKPLKPKPVNNARFDKLGSFWKRWAVDPGNRCLIPTARYAEAVGDPGRMTETWLSVTDQPIFAWAGLWTNSDEWGAVYTGVMTDNAPELRDIHDRSPVILDSEDWETWLHAPLEELYQFDRPFPADRMTIDRTDRPWFRKAGSTDAQQPLL
ncbi:SOS response-associated peptidase [Sphingobium abikonense]|uniref:SOS response-associated peptidase n=1 Tax=Sphingobium abikonense TaxID=86193 RepID=UPI003514C053